MRGLRDDQNEHQNSPLTQNLQHAVVSVVRLGNWGKAGHFLLDVARVGEVIHELRHDPDQRLSSDLGRYK